MVHTRQKHTTSAWGNTQNSHTRAPTAPRVTIQTVNTTSTTPLTQTYTILQHAKAKTNIFNNGRYTTNLPIYPHTVTTTDIKTNMRHIHTSIVSRHLPTRDNNKILRSPPVHISGYEEMLPASLVAPLPNSELIIHPSSNHTYTKSMPNHIHHHYAPSVTLTYTTHIISLNAPTYAPYCHPGYCPGPTSFYNPYVWHQR